MWVIQGLFGGSDFDAGKINNLCFSGMNFYLMLYCANYFRLIMLNKKKKNPKLKNTSMLYCDNFRLMMLNEKKKNSKSKTTSTPWIYVLIILIPFCRSVSLLLKVLCSPSFPLTTACNFLSEAPMLFLIVLIFSGWPLVKPLLLRKDKLLLVGVVLTECFLVPAFTSFNGKGSYTLINQGYDVFGFCFMFLFLITSNNSYIRFLKDLTTSTQGLAYSSVCYIQIFRSLDSYYISYLTPRMVLSLSYFNSFNFFLKEFFFMVLCVALAYKFVPELFYVDGLLPLPDCDDGNVDFLLKHEDEDQETAAIKFLDDLFSHSE